MIDGKTMALAGFRIVSAREALLLPLFHDQVCRFARPEVEGLRLNVAVPEVPYEELMIR